MNRNYEGIFFLNLLNSNSCGFKLDVVLQFSHLAGRLLLLNTIRGVVVIISMSVVIPSILPDVLVAVVDVIMKCFHMEFQMLALCELLTAETASVNDSFHVLALHMLLKMVPLWVNLPTHQTRPLETFRTLQACLLHDGQQMREEPALVQFVLSEC